MPKGPTPRQVARTENIERIKGIALSQLAESGAAELSLRAIARELNLVSSAIYRYFASRDELITALIVDAYNDLAERLEAAAAGARRGPRRRWIDTCAAFRAWAVDEPHRFALIYGSAIPGYRAPQETIAPAARVVRAFCLPAAREAGADGPAGPATPAPLPAGRRLAAQVAAFGGALDLEVGSPTALALAGAFARVVGVVGLELNGHFVGTFDPADDLFAYLVEREADELGL